MQEKIIKSHTTLYVDKKLVELAKTNGINISETLEEALMIKLNLHNEERQELLQRQEKALAEVEFCKKRLVEVNKQSRLEAEKELLDRAKHFRGLVSYGA